jgi:hypothetical protein
MWMMTWQALSTRPEDKEEALAPAALQCELRHYQRRALAFLLSRERARGEAHPAEVGLGNGKPTP